MLSARRCRSLPPRSCLLPSRAMQSVRCSVDLAPSLIAPATPPHVRLVVAQKQHAYPHARTLVWACGGRATKRCPHRPPRQYCPPPYLCTAAMRLCTRLGRWSTRKTCSAPLGSPIVVYYKRPGPATIARPSIRPHPLCLSLLIVTYISCFSFPPYSSFLEGFLSLY